MRILPACMYSKPEYGYKIHDHGTDLDYIRQWLNEVKMDCIPYSNVVYFKSEKDAMFFMLRWQ